MDEEQKFGLYLPDADNPGGEWIGVYMGWPKAIPYPFEICPRYSERGELLCAGLRIGEGAVMRPKSNITRRMLGDLPLGAVLRYILEHEDSPEIDPAVSLRLANTHPLELMLPPESRSVVPGQKGHPDSFYISAAELFKREHVKGSNAEVYRRLAEQLHREESLFRRHVRRGWELRPDLKPDGIRERHVSDEWTTGRLTRKTKPKKEKP
jgi:hypothetical protein